MLTNLRHESSIHSRSLAVLLGTLLLAAACPAEPLPHPSKMPVPPLEFHPPKAERIVLENGMIVHLLEDHELPLLGMSAIVKVGGWLDPDDKLGLADVTGAVMRTGGTASMKPDEINEKLEFIAGSVETGIGVRSGSASLNVLAKDTDLGLKIFADVLMHPAFAQEKIDLRKQQLKEAIRRRNDEPGPICSREFSKRIYAGHPYGRINSLETVDRITRAEIVAFHKKHFFPNNLILGIAGDFKKDEILGKIRKAFAGWEKGTPPADPPEVPFTLKPGVYFVEKDVPQTNLRMGHLGIKKKDPDFFALEVMNFILGGSGFTSRLMREIRSNRGLAYSCGSAFTAGQELGTFMMACQTKSASTAQCIDAMKEIAGKITTEPVTPEELKIARESILNSFVFEFQSSGQIVGQAVSLEYNGLPADYLETYIKRVSEITAEDILAVSKKHLHLDKLTMMVVGKSADFDKPLSTFGKVEAVELEDFSKMDGAKDKAPKTPKEK